MKPKWKLLPVVVASALALMALATSGGAKPTTVSAEVTNVQATDNDVNSGGSVTISFNADEAQGNIGVTLEGVAAGTTHAATITECGSGCPDDNDNVTAPFSITSDSLDGTADTVAFNLQLTCTSNDTVTVRVTQEGVDDTIAITCNASTTPTTTPTVTGTPATATPTVTGTPTGNTITLSAVQPNTTCGAPVFLFATVKDSNGNFVPGATVTFSASGGAGSFAPASAVTVTDGVASSTWTPPSTGTQIVTITSNTGGKTATANVPVNCSAATSTPVPATPVPSTSVRPPSTGEGGTADGSSLPLYAGIATFIGAVFAGAFVVARRQA
jgi:adhesin/invasin